MIEVISGTSRRDHLPNITGVGSFPPVRQTLELIQQLVPGVKTVGTLYNSSEANSRKVIGVAHEMIQQEGITLEEVTMTNSSEVFQAAQAVATREIDALWVTGDNTAFQAFEGIVKVSEDFSLPLIINDPEFTKRGALACQGLGFYKPAYDAATLAARILLGEDPKEIPFQEVKDQKLCLNFEIAQHRDQIFPPKVIEQTDLFFHLGAHVGRPARIAFVDKHSPAPSPQLDQLANNLSAVGMVPDKDFLIHALNAETFLAKSNQEKELKPDVIVVATKELAGQLKHLTTTIPIITLSEPNSGEEPELMAKEIARTLVLRPSLSH